VCGRHTGPPDSLTRSALASDAASRAAAARILAGHIADTAPAVVVATQEVRDVEGLFDRVLLLAEGRIRCDEEADALRARTGVSVDEWMRGGVPA